MRQSPYINNLIKYINILPFSNVEIIYFYSSDLTKPKMIDKFKTFMINSTPCYIINGLHQNYCYIYSETFIKYTVDVISKSVNNNNVVVCDVTILNNSGNVNIGHHIDFSISPKKSGNAVVIKTHKTEYTDIGNCIFERDIFFYCNFTFPPTAQNINLEDIRCEDRDGTLFNNTIKSSYKTNIDINIIKHMLETICKTYGERKKRQQGGTLNNTGFCKFLYDIYLKKIYETRVDLDTVRVFYALNSNIVVFLDFRDSHSKILVINATKAFAAIAKLNNNENIDEYIKSADEAIKIINKIITY